MEPLEDMIQIGLSDSDSDHVQLGNFEQHSKILKVIDLTGIKLLNLSQTI